MSTTHDTTNVKVRLLPLVQFLIENQAKKVSTILEEVITLASPAPRATTTRTRAPSAIRDDADNVVGIYDTYFKRWMPVVGSKAVEFGVKASSNTGFNSMSKVGQNHWAKSNGQAKAILDSLLDKVIKGELTPEQVAGQKAEADALRITIEHTDDGFDTLEDLHAYLASEGVTLQTETPTVTEAPTE